MAEAEKRAADQGRARAQGPELRAKRKMKRRMSPWGANFGSGQSDSATMASGPPDVMANQESAEATEECSGKKKSKFQTFKKLFARKKRKEPSSSRADAELKASQSSDNVSKTSENNTLTRSEKDKGSGSKISLGSKALSHDSVFVSDSSEANEALGASQDSIHGKVKSLQLQLKQAIKLGSPPSIMCVKRTEDAATMSEDDGLPCSPPEYMSLHTTQNQAQRNSSISLEGTDSDEDQLSCSASSRAVSPLVVVPGDFSQPASPFGCLDNSAAKHKLGLRHKACNKRKPVQRLEIKAECDSVVEEMLSTHSPESLEEQEDQKMRDANGDELKPKVEVTEEEEEEEQDQPQHSRQSLFGDKESVEVEDESEAEQDVSRGPGAFTPPEPCLSEEEATDTQTLPSSKPSSRASSVDGSRATPEPPTGDIEYLPEPAGVDYETQKSKEESRTPMGEGEDGVCASAEEDSSFLQEVLSSLKTPLASCSVDIEPEDDVLERKETEGEEAKDEDEELEEPVGHQDAPSGSLLFGQSTEEEEEAVATVGVSSPSSQDVDEEECGTDKDEEEEEEEEIVVERFDNHSQEDEREEEEAEELKLLEEAESLQREPEKQSEEEGEEHGEGQEEALKLEKEPKVEEQCEEELGGKEGKEIVEEATEEEWNNAEDVIGKYSDAADVEDHSVTPLQKADEGVDVVAGGDTDHTEMHDENDDETSTEPGDQESTTVHENQTSSKQSSDEDEENDAEERVEKDIDNSKLQSNQQEDMEAKQVEDLELESITDLEHVEKDQTEESQTVTQQVSLKLPLSSLSESRFESQRKESKTSTPTKISSNMATTTLHINLISPSSEKVTFPFQLSPTAGDPKDLPSHAAATTEGSAASADEKLPYNVEEVREEEQEKKLSNEASSVEEDAPPATLDEAVKQLSSGSDHSKVRFTITSAWHRSLSSGDSKETPSVSPPSYDSPSSSAITVGGADVAATTRKDPHSKAEPASSAKFDPVLSPDKARNAGTTTAKPQSSASQEPMKPQTSAATEESSVVAEGNSDNPFGVRLRKTTALHRFSSEEENTETPFEPPVQPTSCKVESPQPITVKASLGQPINNKPALPKKPEMHGDGGVKTKRISDPMTAARGFSGGSGSPSWISVAKQKQKIYKETSLDDITVKKEEQERKSSLPMYVSSAASKEHSNKTPESTGRVSLLEFNNSSVATEKEVRRALSPPTPVPPQAPKSQPLPCPVTPKPHVQPVTSKHPPQPTPFQRSISPASPVPVPQKPSSCTSPPPLSKTTSSSMTEQSMTLTSSPFSSRTTLPQPASRVSALSGQNPSSQRGLPPPALPQDEPPWMALAKKKAKAWSEMPQIVQ